MKIKLFKDGRHVETVGLDDKRVVGVIVSIDGAWENYYHLERSNLAGNQSSLELIPDDGMTATQYIDRLKQLLG